MLSCCAAIYSLILVLWIDGRTGGKVFLDEELICESSEFDRKCFAYRNDYDAYTGTLRLQPDAGYFPGTLGGYAYARADVNQIGSDTWHIVIPESDGEQDRFMELHAQFGIDPSWGHLFQDGFESGDTSEWSEP